MKYILRKLLIFVVTAWVTLTINFILPRLMPGNPAEAMISKVKSNLNPQALHALEVAFGINTHQSVFVQYFHYLGQVLSGNFGVSLSYYPNTVAEEIAIHMPWTIGLVGIITILSFIAGTMLGIRSGWKRDSLASTVSVPASIFLNAVPYFWIALVLQYVFAFALGWFPLTGAFATSGPKGFALVVSVLVHAILPGLTIFITSLGGWVLTMRNNMLNVLGEDYVTFAFAKGIPSEVIEFNYVARNAMLPNFTGFAMAIGFIVSGALLTEIVFSYPGVGYLIYNAVLNLDYPLMQALFFFITMAILIANLLADVAYVFLDPRVRVGE